MMAVGSELIRLEVEGDGNLKADAPVRESKVATAPGRFGAVEVGGRGAGRIVRQRRRGGPRRAKHAGHVEKAEPPRGIAPGEWPLASPAVRQRAWDMGIELRYVRGTGEAGRILHADLDAYAGTGGGAARGSHAHGYAERNDETDVPVIGLRRAIARKIQEAKRRIPHFSYVEEIDVTGSNRCARN